MILLLLKAIWRTIVISGIAVFLTLAVLIMTKNSSLATFAFPIGIVWGIFTYALEDEQHRTWKQRRRK
jgi:hypothetical protein